jgi:hypothetical protein
VTLAREWYGGRTVLPDNGAKRDLFEILLVGEFYGAHDGWDEYLCLGLNEDGTVTLSSRRYDALAEVQEYIDEDGEEHLPEMIEGKTVSGREGDYVVGGDLLPYDPEITLSVGQEQEAEAWLRDRGWDEKRGYEEAWRRIKWALAGNKTPPLAERKQSARKPTRRRPTG